MHTTPRRRRVLLIEDHDDTREVLAAVLEANDADVTAVSTGVAAIERASEGEKDLVLLDLRLPDVPGAEVARALRATPETSRARIVAVTADATPQISDEAISAGCDGVLTKPLDVQALRAWLAGP